MTVEPRFNRPADYYSSASPQRVLPEWAPYGCGGASLLILIIVFVGGAYLSRGGFVQLMDVAMGMTMGEMRGMYQKDVTAAQKEAVDREIETMRKYMREETISVQALKPVLDAIAKATKDEKVNAREAQMIASTTRKVNATAQPRKRATAQP